MQKNTILKILTDVKKLARQNYKAEIKGIFGSYVRGEANKTSDVDVLVDFREEADYLDLVGLALFLEKKLRHKVDVVPLSSLRKEIKAGVLKEALYL